MELKYSKAKQVNKKPKESRYKWKSEDNLSKTAWRWFSKYIRLRDSDHNGYGACITCGKVDHYKNMHAGHYLSRRYKKIKFDERCCSIQCPYCNTYLHGNIDVYKETIDAKFGKGTAKELESMKNEYMKHDRIFYIAIIEQYKLKVKELEKNIPL